MPSGNRDLWHLLSGKIITRYLIVAATPHRYAIIKRNNGLKNHRHIIYKHIAFSFLV